MTNIVRKIKINAPVEKVFQFVTRPENWTKYVTSFVDVRDLSSRTVEQGTTFAWKFRMLGMDFGGKGTITANVTNERFGMKMEGGFPITENYGFKAVDGGTELAVEVIYETPSRIMEAVSKSGLVEKLN